MEAVFFRWNDDRSKLKDVDGYFLPGGFSTKTAGSALVVRDPLMEFIGRGSGEGQGRIGNCNGAQILIESPDGTHQQHLDMSLARNVVAEQPLVSWRMGVDYPFMRF